jgi:hypothetical protein
MVNGMHNDFVFVMQSLMRARGSEFQKMHVKFCVNILDLRQILHPLTNK